MVYYKGSYSNIIRLQYTNILLKLNLRRTHYSIRELLSNFESEPFISPHVFTRRSAIHLQSAKSKALYQTIFFRNTAVSSKIFQGFKLKSTSVAWLWHQFLNRLLQIISYTYFYAHQCSNLHYIRLKCIFYEFLCTGKKS